MKRRKDEVREYIKQVIFDNRNEIINGCRPIKDTDINEYLCNNTVIFEEYEVYFKGNFSIAYELEFNNCKVVFEGKITTEKNIKFKNCEIIFGEIYIPRFLASHIDLSHQHYINQEFEKKITIEFIGCDIYQEDFDSISKTNKLIINDNIGPIIQLYDGDIILINCKIKNVVDLIESR